MTQTQIQSVDIAEQKGRDIIRKYIYESYLSIDNPEHIFFDNDFFARIDTLFTSTTQNLTHVKGAGEIKYRNYRYSTSHDWMIEINKYNALMEKYQKEQYIPYYFNITNDSKIITWNLKKFDIKKLNKMNMELKATTAYHTIIKEKDYYDLPVKTYPDQTKVQGITVFQYSETTSTPQIIYQH
jgi:hypothetical protein